ncbi:M23 family metallopeptidase [Microbacterium sp. PRF11]|uniref:M23 family metallopeptidase n=1 Tax=Microbacterium sp. PRF11 TaxID=2962593 RepID=UPI0028821B8A|nr:M23 family metallopeptidase [Microbacterium sp. PRF11]MDT0117586.1 M23 family metallopeptidase [Microbacterium sp. PRF11]
MAEHNDPAADLPEVAATGPTRRTTRTAVARTTKRPVRTAAPTTGTVARSAAASRTTAPRRGGKPLRSAVILSMVAGLVATVAIPAYAATVPAAETVTLQQMSAPDNQSLVVASDATAEGLDRSSYSATTAEEIQKKKDQEAAAAAAAERARELAAKASQASTSVSSVDLNMTAPGSGEVRWPLTSYTLGRGLWDSGYHQGVDLLAPGGQPIFAAAAGVVSVSQESYGGYGVAIVIEHVINGQKVSTTYGHMTYGSRQVQAGQTVAAGQLIGLVGSTGSSTANHLHFEVHINGSVVDPYAWLQQNAG